MMPIYEWSCEKCEQLTIVERKLAEYEIGPENCVHCKHSKLNRRPAYFNDRTKGFILEGSGWFRHGYQNWDKEKEKKKQGK